MHASYVTMFILLIVSIQDHCDSEDLIESRSRPSVSDPPDLEGPI